MSIKDDFRALLDKHEIMHRVDDDGNFVATYDDDEGRDMMVHFIVTENYIQLRALSLGKDVPEIAGDPWVHQFCNDWNLNKIFPKAYYNPYLRRIMGEFTFFLGEKEKISKEYIETMIVDGAYSLMSPLHKAMIQELASRKLLKS